MKIDDFEMNIEKSKERSPETFNEIMNITIPFYMLQHKMYTGMCKLQEDKYQLTNSELDVLHSLKIYGNEKYILSPTRLKERLLFTSGAITKILKKLEEKKYIKRIDSKYDKRSKQVQLTQIGDELQSKALKDVLNFEEKCLSPLNKEEKEIFKNLLLKALKNN